MKKDSEIVRKSMYTLLFVLCILIAGNTSCSSSDSTEEEEETLVDVEISGEPFTNPEYNMDRTISDGAQRNTIAFDALGFMIGDVGAQSFLPPGKVADYNGFQYFRDNDQTNLGHNTSFVSIIANNILNILTDAQVDMFIDAAHEQIDMINEYAYKRFPLCKAFRRLLENDLPDGTTGLDKDAIMQYSADLYRIDGEISYKRTELFGAVINSLSNDQKAAIKDLYDLQGIGNWPSSLDNQLEGKGLDKDVNVAVMTYASEIYTWYAGSVTGDVYFCPERQGTYFGSFYLKDWPAMGNPNYTIDEQITATAGQSFFDILNDDQYAKFNQLVIDQQVPLSSLVDARESIAIELRKFLDDDTANQQSILSLSDSYGAYDGEIIYLYATCFAEVYQSLSEDQKSQVIALGNDLGYLDPTGAFLYSEPIAMPTIENTDYLFN